MTIFTGTFTALVTPFTASGDRVDLRRLEEHVARQGAAGVTGVVPCGTTGETPTLTESEHRQVVETAVRAGRRHGLHVVAGAGSNSTARAISLHRLAAELGASAALHVCPYYNKPSQEGLYRHFSLVADACDLPVVLYNVPGRTAVALEIDTIVRLAAHPNIRAVKEASGSTSLASRIMARTDLAVLSGDDPLTFPLMALGAAGVVSVLSNIAPGHVAQLCTAVSTGDLDLARELHGRLLPLAEALLSLDTNPVPVKTAMALLGLDSGAVRLPLAPPDASTRQRLAELLEDAALDGGSTIPVAAAAT